MKKNVVKSLILMMAMMPMCVFAQKTNVKEYFGCTLGMKM